MDPLKAMAWIETEDGPLIEQLGRLRESLARAPASLQISR